MSSKGPRARVVRARRGFTLIELMVAILILAVGLLSLAGTAAMMTQMIGAGARRTITANVAQSRFEALRRIPCAQLLNGSATSQGIQESWTVDSVRMNHAFMTNRVTYSARTGYRSRDFRSVRPC